jgi:hypothetical protein
VTFEKEAAGTTEAEKAKAPRGGKAAAKTKNDFNSQAQYSSHRFTTDSEFETNKLWSSTLQGSVQRYDN